MLRSVHHRRRRRIAPLGVIVLGMTLAGVARGESATAPIDDYDPQQLEAMLQVGLQDLDSIQDRCATEGATADPDASRTLARAAGMIGLFALRYPFPADAEHERTDRLRWAVNGYEQAYNCDPGWDQRRYLHEALALVTRRLEPDDDRLGALTDEDREALLADKAHLEGRLGALKAPRCMSEVECGTRRQSPSTSVPEAQVRGYRARWRERLALGIEFGGGAASVLFLSTQSDSMSTPFSASILTLGVAPGIRLLAGTKQRAVFHVGSHYGLYRFREGGTLSTVHSLVTRLGAGVRVHQRWFSLHSAAEVGVAGVVGAKERHVGSGVVGGSVSLCTWGEALCAIARLQYSLSRYNYFDPIVGLVGLDIFRVIDNALAKETAS